MKKNIYLSAKLMALLVGLGCFVVPTSTFAVLGEDVASVQSDAVKMKASVRTTPLGTSVVHEIRGSGVVLREYVSPVGKVFAVAWEGISLPDFSQVLGSYFRQFQQVVQLTHRRGRGPAIVETPELVAYSGGHMRAFSGKAYIPRMVPQGIDPGSIK